MIPRLRLAAVVLLGVCLSTSAHPASTSTVPHKVVVVVANRLALDDFTSPSLPGLSALVRGGAIGLVSPNCAGRKNETSIMLTAAAGVGCRGGAFVRDCRDAEELVSAHLTAADEFSIRTGFAVDPGTAVFLGLPQAVRANTGLPGPARLGMMGDAIREAGGRTCVIGSADVVPLRLDRSAAVLGMGSDGRADIGMLARLDGSANNSPACVAIPDPVRLSEAIDDALKRAELVIIDFGCTRSLDDLQLSFSEESYAAHRTRALQALDQLSAMLAARSREQDFGLVLVSFCPPARDWAKRLSPIVLYGGETGSGVLTSPTTRTRGLIAASDFAPTVLSMAGTAAPQGIFGRQASVIPGSRASIPTLRDLDTRTAAGHRLMAPLIWVIAAVGAAVLGLSALLIAIPTARTSHTASGALRVLMLAAALSFLAMLLASLAPAGIIWYVAAFILWLLVLTFACSAQARKNGVYLAFALTAAAVIMDAATGGTLCKFAAPSSFQLSGLRYYGIGNEYAGALIACAALAVLMFGAGRAGGWLWGLGTGIVVTGFLATGALGANYGGAVASAVTFGLLVMSMKTGGFGARHVALSVICGALIVIFMAVLDARVSGIASSHAGRLTGMVEGTGWTQVFVLAARKGLLNLRLAASGNALKAYIIFLPFIVIWFARIRTIMHTSAAFDDRRIAGLKAVTVGAAAAAVFNDSGIVMAAIMLGMLSVMILYSLMSDAIDGSEAVKCRV